MIALLTVHEVAAILKVSPRQVGRLIEQGRLPSFLLTSESRRIRAADLERWIDSIADPQIMKEPELAA